MDRHLVSIIIVNHNGRHLLKGCLESVFAQSYRNFELILVDNGSSDGSVEFVRENFPSVRVVALNENRGFAGGNNEGLRYANGEFIALLNNDAFASRDWLKSLVGAILMDERIGICSSKIIIEGTNKIDSAGDVFTTAFTGTKMGEFQDEDRFSVRRFVPGACAAAVLYRRAMLDEIGFFDDDFFLNHEDTDLNMRAWLAGWRCIFVPEAVVYHKVSASIGYLSDTSVYYFARNTEWVWIKNVPFRLMLRYLPQRIMYEIASFGYSCILKNRWRPFIRGKVDALIGLPLMIKKRRQVQPLIRLTGRQIRKELIPISRYLKDKLMNMR